MSKDKDTTVNVSAVSPMVVVAEDAPKDTGLFRLPTTPRGYKLFNYTAGVFMTLGIWNGRGKVFQKEDLVKFFATDSVYSHHLGCGNLEETKTGVKLSKAGWTYFKGRLTGSDVGMKKFVPEAEALSEAMQSGKLPKATVHFEKGQEFVPVRG